MPSPGLGRRVSRPGSDGVEYRYEKSGEREYLFADDGDPIVKRLLALGTLEVLHRKATLEDLFLKLTGRGLE